MKSLEFCKFIVLMSFLIFSFGCVTTGESNISPSFHDLSPEKVALVEVIGDQRNYAQINQVEDYFVSEMQEKGYTVMPRIMVMENLSKHDFDISEQMDNQKASQIGKILDVPAVTMLEVHMHDETVNISGRMIDSETTEVIWSGSSRGGDYGLLSSVRESLMGSAVGAATQSVPVGGHGGHFASQVAGDLASEAEGRALSLEVTQALREAVRNLVQDLPQR